MLSANVLDFRRADADQVRVTAQHYRALADDLDRLAREKAAYEAYFHPEPPPASRDALVALEMQRGHTLPETIRKLTSEALSGEDIRFLWNYLRPKMAARQKRRRDLFILRLWKLGKSDQDIASAADCTARTVQRIISKARHNGY